MQRYHRVLCCSSQRATGGEHDFAYGCQPTSYRHHVPQSGPGPHQVTDSHVLYWPFSLRSRDHGATRETPGRVMLGAAQLVRLLCRVERGHGPVRPGEPALGWFVFGSEPRRRQREDSALAFHHHVSGIGGGRSDQGQASAPVLLYLLAYPLPACAGLPEPPACQYQPHLPGPGGCNLLLTCPEGPIVEQPCRLLLSQRLDDLPAALRVQRCERAAVQGARGYRRGHRRSPSHCWWSPPLPGGTCR